MYRRRRAQKGVKTGKVFEDPVLQEIAVETEVSMGDSEDTIGTETGDEFESAMV